MSSLRAVFWLSPVDTDLFVYQVAFSEGYIDSIIFEQIYSISHKSTSKFNTCTCKPVIYARLWLASLLNYCTLHLALYH